MNKRVLYFLQLQKFEKRKYLYFFVFWLICKIWPLFWILRFSEKSIFGCKKIKARSFKGAFKNDYFSVIDRTFPHMGKIVKLILIQNWSRFNFFYEQIVFSEKFTISQKSLKNLRKNFLQIVLT